MDEKLSATPATWAMNDSSLLRDILLLKRDTQREVGITKASNRVLTAGVLMHSLQHHFRGGHIDVTEHERALTRDHSFESSRSECSVA